MTGLSSPWWRTHADAMAAALDRFHRRADGQVFGGRLWSVSMTGESSGTLPELVAVRDREEDIRRGWIAPDGMIWLDVYMLDPASPEPGPDTFPVVGFARTTSNTMLVPAPLWGPLRALINLHQIESPGGRHRAGPSASWVDSPGLGALTRAQVDDVGRVLELTGNRLPALALLRAMGVRIPAAPPAEYIRTAWTPSPPVTPG